jgi:hypothetical protein
MTDVYLARIKLYDANPSNIKKMYLICQPTNTLNEIQFMTNINLLQVLALGCRFQESFRSNTDTDVCILLHTEY